MCLQVDLDFDNDDESRVLNLLPQVNLDFNDHDESCVLLLLLLLTPLSFASSTPSIFSLFFAAGQPGLR